MAAKYASEELVKLLNILTGIDCKLGDNAIMVNAREGREGGFIAFSPSGKVIILKGVTRAGWCLAEISQVKDTCYVAHSCGFVSVPLEGTTWHEQCSIDASGFSHPEGLCIAVHATVCEFKANRKRQREEREAEEARRKELKQEKLD
jgi:hypothetical protein